MVVGPVPTWLGSGHACQTRGTRHGRSREQETEVAFDAASGLPAVVGIRLAAVSAQLGQMAKTRAGMPSARAGNYGASGGSPWHRRPDWG